MERFDRKMALVQDIEGLMEECLDQDIEILYPRPEGEGAVVREHEAYAHTQRAGHLLSVPLRLNREPMAVLLCERRGASFTEEEVRGLRIVCDQAVRRLADLHAAGRWFVARWKAAVERGLACILGPEHTLAKLAAVTLTLLLAFLLFGSWHYRVDANFILRAENLSHLPAPFDGYIEEVHAEVGDAVKQGDVLLELNTDTLLLNESEAIADYGFRAREEEKARAAQQFADMRIAEALKDQAKARLDEIRYHLARAHSRAHGGYRRGG